ncbi:hypothetical protein [Gracilimonas sediminicola]|uniref:hypothetical protein n=1 Tax=Gracilimonas sediminicola TaxID=2952158 RepID=UPI0038D48616
MAQQPSLGIVWDHPADTSEAKTQLNTFAQHGIDYLQLDHPVSPDLLALLREAPFTILIQLDKTYLTLSEIRSRQSNLLQQFGEATDLYRSYLNFAAIGLLSNSQTSHPEFDDMFSPILDSLSARSNKDFYFYASDKWSYFDTPDKPFAVLFADSVFQRTDIAAFDEQFGWEVDQNSSLIFFLRAEWFDEAISAYPEFSESLMQYEQSQEWKIPLPAADESRSSQSWMVLSLVVLWLGLAVLFKLLPYLRPMLLRYFLAHRFFVDDILHYRERALTGGIALLAMHALFSGMMFYILAQTSISLTGLNAFFHHLPTLAIFGTNYASFFGIGVIITLLIQTVALLWLYLPAKNLEHFSQTVNLYSGTFFLDFLIVTILVTLYVTGFGPTAILIFGALFVLIWYGAFNISAFDISRSSGPGTAIYLFLTVGLHTLFSIGLLVLFFTNDSILQVFELALSL